MTRTILAGLAVVVSAVSFLGTGCQSTGIGDPCTPEREYDTTFSGFVEQEVSTEGESFQCQSRLCLVNHFQGRVSCPYGQSATGMAVPPATQPCFTPGIASPVTGPLDSTGAPVDKTVGESVSPQCTDRTADKTVYCSCRCADINGTQNGGNFCNCPDGFSCTQLVSSLSAATDQGLTGAYCIKAGTQFSDSATSAGANACPKCGVGSLNCGNANNTGGS
jgi:hypothetical protein